MSAPRRKRVLAALAVLATSIAVIAWPSAAFATPGVVIQATLTQTDGAAPFDADSAPGHDSGPNNGVVRTNDTIGYQINLNANLPSGDPGTAVNLTWTLQLPQGVALPSLPPYCVTPGSSLTPATLPAPTTPVTSTSYQSLARQTLTCNVGDRSTGQALTFPLDAKVRPEMPNGTVLGPIQVSAVSDESPQVQSNEVSATVSARAQYDFSKNGAVATTANQGSISTSQAACPFDAVRTCAVVLFPMTIGAVNGGIGNSPMAMPFTLTDNVTAAALFPTLTPDQIAAINADPGKYGASFGCLLPPTPDIPGVRLGSTASSVRNSGAIACTQPGGRNTAGTVTISSTSGNNIADMSGYTCPTQSGTGAVQLNGGQCWVVSYGAAVYIPMDTVLDFGLAGPDGQRFTLTVQNTFTNLTGTDISGTTSDPTANLAYNDSRRFDVSAQITGSFDKHWAGVPGDTRNTPATTYTSGNGGPWSGPPGVGFTRAGNGAIAPGQTVLSAMNFTYNSGGLTTSNRSFVGCDYWDNTILSLTPGNYDGPAATRGYLQITGSAGDAAWWSGSRINNDTSRAAAVAAGTTVSIEYGTGATPTAGGDCAGGTWYSSLADVPGGAAAVNAVRATAVIPAPAAGNQLVGVSIALTALSVSGGTIAPNFGAYKQASGTLTRDQILAAPGNWQTSTYVPATNVGVLGDRLTVSEATVRVLKEVRQTDGSWTSTNTPSFTTNGVAEFRLTPNLLTYVVGESFTATIEDCVPAGFAFVASSQTPLIATTGGSPADAALPCPSGSTYLRWQVDDLVGGQAATPITYSVRVTPIAAAGVATNQSRIGSPADVVSTPEQRSSNRALNVVVVGGTYLEKSTPNPVVQPNRAGQTTLEPLIWDVTMAYITGGAPVSNPVWIDVLPAAGASGSSFAGTLAFSDATVTAGSGATIEYTSDPAPNPDPNANTSTWVADPSTLDTVTALRVTRPGAFTDADAFTVRVRAFPTGDRDGDIFNNTVQGRATGLALPVGPVASAITVQGASIGERVWWDADYDGIYQDGDDPVPGVPVTVRGTDDLGNTVEITTTTDADGSYLFPDLRSGTYTVDFAAPNGSEFTIQGDVADPATSKPPIGTGVQQTPAFSLTPGEVNISENAGLVTPGVSLSKADSDPPNGEAFVVGDVIEYTFTITNTGQAPLSSVQLSEIEFVDGEGNPVQLDAPPSPPDGFDGTLAPGASAVFTAAHTVSQADARAGGELRNTANATGLSPAEQTVADDDSAAAPIQLAVPPAPTPEPSGGGLAGTGNNLPILPLAALTALFLLGGGMLVLRGRRQRAKENNLSR